MGSLRLRRPGDLPKVTQLASAGAHHPCGPPHWERSLPTIPALLQVSHLYLEDQLSLQERLGAGHDFKWKTLMVLKITVILESHSENMQRKLYHPMRCGHGEVLGSMEG